MKKKLYMLLVILLTIEMLTGVAFAGNVPWNMFLNDQYESFDQLKEKMKNISEEYFERTENSKTFAIKVTLTKKQDENGNIYLVFGKEENNVLITNIDDINHLEADEDRNVGDTWNVWIDAEYISTDDTNYRVQTAVIYDDDGNFIPEEHSWNGAGRIVDEVGDVVEGAVDFIGGIIGGIKDFVENLTKNFWGTVCTLLLDLAKSIADAFQIFIADSFQTVSLNTYSDYAITYSKEFLEKDGSGKTTDKGAGNRDAYTKIGKYKKGNEDESGVINVDGEALGFDKDTPIPVIPGELYYLSLGKVNFLDANFLSRSNESSDWMLIRNVASLLIHITLYITAAVLLVLLVYNGIRMVTHAYTTPDQRMEIMDGIRRFALSVAMLIGTVLVMALSIYGSNALLDSIKMDNEYEGPIRVNVKSAGYSFSTTITGYYRYMAEIEDVDKSSQKAMYTGAYFVLVLVNCISSLAMLFRMLGLMMLSVAGPIISALASVNVKAKFKYTEWVISYILLSLTQVVFGVIYLIILKGVV